MQFEWDNQKAESNIRKHRISFNEAITVFYDPLALIFDDEGHSLNEKREIIIGNSLQNNLLIVYFTERGVDTIRIFSARKTTKKERMNYEKKTIK